jgi:uncharacterized membrane protein YdbT with pleckstrin-like domain
MVAKANPGGQAEFRPTFPGQHESEAVKLVFRQHPLVMRKELIFGMLAIVLAELLWALPSIVMWVPQWLGDIGWRVLGFTLLAVIAYWFYHWLGWYYSVYIVTDERIVEVRQKGFFNRRVTEFGLDKVQNVNYHIKGFQAVLFQFGDIIAQTYVGDLVMPTIHRPVQIHQKLVDIVREANSSARG